MTPITSNREQATRNWEREQLPSQPGEQVVIHRGSIDPPDDTWKPSDMAFQMYLDAVSPETFSSWEWRVYQHERLRITKGN